MSNTDVQAQEHAQQMWRDGLSQPQIAALLKVSTYTIRAWLSAVGEDAATRGADTLDWWHDYLCKSVPPVGIADQPTNGTRVLGLGKQAQ